MIDTDLQGLIERIGADHVARRLAVETRHEAQLFGQGTLLFNVENWKRAPRLVEAALKATGLYGRARRNADRVEVRRNLVISARLPAAFDGFTILQLSDLHADISPGAMRHLMDIVRYIACDICVLTGDYRGRTFGPFDASLAAMKDLCARIKLPLYGILGNHDSIRMAPALEAMGIRMLFNESEAIKRGGETIYLAGIDDAHFYRADDIPKAAAAIPHEAFSLLLAHTPESYREAAKAGFDLMLSGHTHGGQLCLPGGIPIKLEARLPRRMGAGAWRFDTLAGYTSAGAGTSLAPVRLNCPAEITVHTLRRPG
ncbi:MULTISPECIES: metallophosphoesterase [unclassified Bradyrhizobium]|uniref:metallophosphoesterase n=1 Tax=unclassified Bradyrhizobium TaxID=2631580 RepID=UPI00247971F6|nr:MULTISPECIES: metallophosphoesterase [unclassified Bradyrhizobium]WGS20549.1 metallophosphoesterase [Bradyrhizobium sp. ISRA463]WGS27434.1 metallophosphoesterase [Bradyrhizobium sp. ISRA464]